MITPFLWCCFLGVALGQNEEYGLPPEENFVGIRAYSNDAPLPYPASHPRLSNAQKDIVSELLTFPQHQRQVENEEVPSEPQHLDDQPSGDKPPPLPAEQYGLPPEGQSLQNPYSGGAQQQSDKSAAFQSSNLNESPPLFQDQLAGVAIVPYPESHYKKYSYNSQSYAPYHQTNYVDDTQKYYIPQPQSSSEHHLTAYQLESYADHHREPKYPTPVAQNRVQESVPSSAPHQIYEVPEAYRNQQAQYTKYDSQITENLKHRVPTNYQIPLDRYTNYEVPTNYRKSPEIPVRYIAVFQKHRAPGKSDVATSSFLTQRLQNYDYRQAGQTGAERTGNPLVLPLSPNFRYSSPSGSISSTFISKDVGLLQGARQSLPRQDAEEGSDVSTQFNPQDTYGLPNF